MTDQKPLWRVALARLREDLRQRCYVSGTTPEDAAESFADDYFADMSLDPFENSPLHVAVWVGGVPTCYAVEPRVEYEASETDWPAEPSERGDR